MLGAGYGAVLGALTMGFGSGDVFLGGFGGAMLGLVAGTALGIVAVPAGTRLGGCWAAILAGVIVGGIAPSFAVSGQVIEDAPFRQASLWGLLTTVTPPLLAAALGLAVVRGLHAGRSLVPGVQGVVNAIHAAREIEASRERVWVASEPLPASAPAGCGDEPSPVGGSLTGECHG